MISLIIARCFSRVALFCIFLQLLLIFLPAMKTLFLVLAVLITLTFQQPIQRCYLSPDSWSGVFFVFDYAQKTRDHGNIYYNRTGQKILYDYNDYNGRTSDVKKVWFFYEEMKSYTLDENTRMCTVEDIPSGENFPLFGAPENATFHHRDQLGSFIGDLGVATNYFRMDTEDGGVFHGYYAFFYNSFERDRMCIPVILSYEKIDTAPTHQRNAHFMFMNITINVQIESQIWELPSECLH